MKTRIGLVAAALSLTCAVYGQSLVTAEYFFDTDPGVGNGTALAVTAADTVQFTGTVSASGLSSGFHILYIRARNTTGVWSLSERRPVFIQTPVNTGTLVAAEYYFDTDPGVGNGTALSVTTADTVLFSGTVSGSGLASGFHILYIRARGADGRWSLVERRPVHVLPPAVNNPSLLAAEYFVDTDPGYGMGSAISLTAGDTIDFTGPLPVANTDTGQHFLFVRVMNANGVWSLNEPRAFAISNSIGLPELADAGRPALFQNRPNPFAETTVIEYYLDVPGPVEIRIEDLLGRTVQAFHAALLPGGRHQFVPDRSLLQAGCYVYRMVAGDYSDARIMQVTGR